MCFLERTQVLFSLMFNLSTGAKHKAVGPDQPPAYILPQYDMKSSWFCNFSLSALPLIPYKSWCSQSKQIELQSKYLRHLSSCPNWTARKWAWWIMWCSCAGEPVTGWWRARWVGKRVHSSSSSSLLHPADIEGNCLACLVLLFLFFFNRLVVHASPCSGSAAFILAC